jgi:phospholipase/carboxylesterase
LTAISEVLYRGPKITQASQALIVLHGRGGTAQGMLDLSDQLCDQHFYIAAPQATHHVWYPYNFMEEEERNEPDLSLSIQAVKELIDQTAKHIPKQRIFIVGFSQGACLTLEVATRHAQPYGGIVAFTGGLIGKTVDESKYRGDFRGTKVFISDGDDDPYVPLIRVEESQALMEKLNAHVTVKVYKGRAHTISEEEIKFVRKNITLKEQTYSSPGAP